jgi:hypothetical protein
MGRLKPREPVAGSENNIWDAKQALRSGEVTSIHSAASMYGIAYDALQEWFRGA